MNEWARKTTTCLVESPLPYLLFAGLFAAFFAVHYLRTRRKCYVVAVLACGVLGAVGVALERRAISDGEAVQAVVHEFFASIESNDLSAVLDHIWSEDWQMPDEAARGLKLYEFERVRVVSPIQVEFFDDMPIPEAFSHPAASVACRGEIRVKKRRSNAPPTTARVDLVMVFGRKDGRWLLLGYSYKVADQRTMV